MTTTAAAPPHQPATAPRRRRGRRVAIGAAAVLLVVVLGALVAVGWYYSDEILLVPEPTPSTGDTEVLAVDPAAGTVTLERTEASAEPGTWGLRGAERYTQVGEVVGDDGSSVVRRFTALPDVPVPGDDVVVDGYAHPEDPGREGFDFPVEEVVVDGPLGPLPALHAPGEDDTWVVFVHGRGATRAEGFRLLPAVVGAGHPALLVSYRNDPDAPADPDGRYGLGWTEWEDVQAAVRWAQAQGAADVVLAASSMGGAIVGRYDAVADDLPVRGMILDAPVVDWSLPLRAAAIDRGVPTALTPWAQTVVTLRTGLRWGEVSLLERADDLDAPILLFHGDADATVPVEGSDALAAARPDLVEYVRLPGVDHVRAWNADPDAYADAVTGFLERVG